MGNFREGLIFERKRQRISQEDLSIKSGVSQQAISLIESGKRSPTESTMGMLAAGLGCSINYLINFSDGAEKDPPPSAGDGSRERLISLLEQIPSDQIQDAIDLLTMLKELHKRL